MNISKSKKELAAVIDHTLLKQNTTKRDIRNLCSEAVDCGFYSVCIPPCFVSAASRILKNEEVKVCTVIGFPLGFSTKETKIFEAEKAVNDGAEELDLVINIGYIYDNRLDMVEGEINSVLQCIPEYIKLKVIIETALLTEEQKMSVTKTILETQADFIKTSTGFAHAGASTADIKLISSITGGRIGIKASGGIKTYDFAAELIRAGATRIGSSKSVDLINFKKIYK